MPSLIFFTDTLGLSIGGYNLIIGQTWNLQLAAEILQFTIINHLEFLAFLVQLLLTEFDGILEGEYILGWIDNWAAIS